MVENKNAAYFYEFRRISCEFFNIDHLDSENLIKRFDFCNWVKTARGEDDDES